MEEPESKELDMIEYNASTVLGRSAELMQLLQEESDDDEPFYTSSDLKNQMNEEQSEPVIEHRELTDESVKVEEENRTVTMKSARREDTVNGHDLYSPRAEPRTLPIRSIRRKFNNSTTTPHSPVSTASLRFSPNLRSPFVGMATSNLLSTPIFSATPREAYSTPSSSLEGIYPVNKEFTVTDSGSLERNVSSLNIAKDNVKKELPPPTRENYLLRSPSPPPPLPPPPPPPATLASRDDVFIPPAAVVRNGNNHDNGFRGYQSRELQQSSHPPRIQEKIIIKQHEYTILQQLGKGSSGIVFLVFCSTYHDLFALKWIEVKRELDRQNVQNEITLMNSLKDDKNIVTLLDYKETSGAIYLIMEYGEIDLARLMGRALKNRWDINFIRYYWNQMLHAVSAIHQKNIVHSDLKPANFVVVKGQLKLIDFGIAKTVPDDTTNIHRDIQVGTLNYMAPEALVNSNEGREGADSLIKLGRPSDVWSLGCILYQMVYGKTPFYHLQLTQKLCSIPNPNYEIPFPEEATYGESLEKVQVPQVLIKLLKLCLDRNPAYRPPLTELMMHPFVN